MAQTKQVYTWRRFAALICVILNIIVCLLTAIFIDYSLYNFANDPYVEVEFNKLYVRILNFI